jgi:Tol biopolymer transport system component
MAAKAQICVMDANGANVRTLTKDDTRAFFNPVWSPDGKSFVYYVEKGDQKDQIWTMNADGTGQTLLTNNIGHNYYPSWLPDGSRVLFTSLRDGAAATIYTMKPDGSDLKRLTEAMSGRFSPDGKWMAIITGGATGSRVMIANPDGSPLMTILPK